MKLTFEKQEYQEKAVASVVDLFKGQENESNPFSLVKEDTQEQLFNDFGIGNKLSIGSDRLIKNMNEIQKLNGQELTKDLENNNFCVEMETGTGKTYVYTKTIFELNKKYGFKKFIIVVPSVAIREGVHKSLEITEDHFKRDYGNVPINYFIYDSKKLNNIRHFAVSNNIEVMIINIQSFINDDNIINRAMDKMNGEAPIRYIQDTNPVVIIDEPQSVDSTEKSKEAIRSLNPLAVLRYSATHRDKLNVLYKLTPVDAYNQGLVKQISVFSDYVSFDYNRPFVRLVEVSNKNGFKAKVEIDIANDDGKVSRKVKTVKQGDDLFILSGERELYEGFVVSGIDCTEGYESIEFANTTTIKQGNSIGDVQEDIIKRSQIKSTIEIHLDKELRLLEKDIKVLSLFFIDKVDMYRDNGEYAKIFEECYNELIQREKYAPIRDKFTSDVAKIHGGYFSKDKKGVLKDTKGDTQADFDTYTTIMKEKEWLLSFECPLRFIWSHSALREGWDNPNVFQICTLIDQKSTFSIRQKIGRGLRLCVDQTGKRVKDKNINRLHVMANESFSDFVSKLQKEIETETGVKFGIIQMSLFSGLSYNEKVVDIEVIDDTKVSIIEKALEEQNYIVDNKPTEKLFDDIKNNRLDLSKNVETEVRDKIIEEVLVKKEDFRATDLVNKSVVVEKVVEKKIEDEDSVELIKHLQEKNYIDNKGNVKQTLKEDLKNNTLDLPKKYNSSKDVLISVLNNATRTAPPIDDERNRVNVKIKKEILLDDNSDFRELWNKISQKTIFRYTIDNDEFKKEILKGIKTMEKIPKVVIERRIADIEQSTVAVSSVDRSFKVDKIETELPKIPDILKILLLECNLPKTLSRDILVESGRISEFLNNPQLFIEKLIEVIKNAKGRLAVDGIKYIKVDGEEYGIHEVFDSEELVAYLNKNAIAVEHSIYDHVIYDSEGVEKTFAQKLDNDEDVRFFFKIPPKFKIKTPVGSYNPDWAVYMNKDGVNKMYFVIETKGSTTLFDLRHKEELKILYGKKHFEALGGDVGYEVETSDWEHFKRIQ